MKEKTVFVSGGARGLGASLVSRAVADGANVFCASRNGSLPEGMAAAEKSKCRAGKLDTVDYASCEASINQCLECFGRIDVLINNASGYFGGKAIGMYTPDEMRNEVEATLLGTLFLTNAFVSLANRTDVRQHIVSISSISGLSGEQDNGLSCVYAAAKAGVIRFTETINETLKDVSTSAHVLIPNNIRADSFVKQSAISFEDVYSAIRFLLDSSDNLYVGQLVLNPFIKK